MKSNRTTQVVFEKDEDSWWTVYLAEYPLASGFGSSIGKAIFRMTQKIRQRTGEQFIYHPATVVYVFETWPPTRFTEDWVVTARGLGRVRTCFT